MLKTIKLAGLALFVLILSCKDQTPTPTDGTKTVNTQNFDANDDGKINILVIGTSKSIKNGGEEFSPDQIAAELKSILSAESSLDQTINIEAEDIYRTSGVKLGLGQAGNEYTWQHYCHSLTQYYYWPDGHEERLNKLAGKAGTKWDFVVIAADPYLVGTLPGFYSLGVNKIASKAQDGGAKPLLLMIWPKNDGSGTDMDNIAEFTYRTDDGAKAEIETVPAGLAWKQLSADKKDNVTAHPSPNGSYLAAASIFAHVTGGDASSSDYEYDDEIAKVALDVVNAEADRSKYSGEISFMSPFRACGVTDDTLNYNHTGSSSENGILSGLRWVLGKAGVTLVKNGDPPINFNYGRANTNFEANKRYKIDPASFDYSFGFPMQDHSNYGNTSMLYGIDRRISQNENGTDVGTALYMVRESELPYARAIPIRTIYAQMKEANPAQSAFRDAWHMHGNLDKAVGAYMYTLLTGKCVLGPEPADKTSAEWATWMAHKIGYETAWNLMHLSAHAPGC